MQAIRLWEYKHCVAYAAQAISLFDKIYLHTKWASRQDSRSEKDYDRYNNMEIKGRDDIMDPSKYPDGNKKIVVFDDLLNSLVKIQSKIAKI